MRLRARKSRGKKKEEGTHFLRHADLRHRQPSLCLALAFSVPVNFVENALALRLRMDRTAACLSAEPAWRSNPIAGFARALREGTPRSAQALKAFFNLHKLA